MPKTGGTTISMFDIRKVEGGAKFDGDGVRIIDSYLFEIETEKQQNSDMRAIEQKIVTKTTERGFTIEMMNGAQTSTIADPIHNPRLQRLWKKETKKAIRHRTNNGFVVVQIREIQQPPEGDEPQTDELATLAELAAEDEVEHSGGEDNEDPLEQEIADLSRLSRKSRQPPSLRDAEVLAIKVPRVVDPLYECYVKFYTKPDKSRVYLAFDRTNVTNAEPLPNTFVHVFFEPNAEGKPQSPFIYTLEDFQQLRTYRERHEVRDWKLTYPPLFYIEDSKKETIIPNSTTITQAEAADDDAYADDFGLPQTNGPVPSKTVNLTKDSLTARRAQLNWGRRWMQNAIVESVHSAMPTGTSVEKQHFNAQLNRQTRIGGINHFEPYIVMPEHMDISSHAPQVKQGDSYEFTILQTLARIANNTGILPEWLTGERAKVGADVNFRQSDNDAVIREIQEDMEEYVGELYVRIFSPVHKQSIGHAVREARFRLRLDALAMAKAAREEKRREVTAKIAEINVMIEQTGEENSRAALDRTRTQYQKILNSLDDPAATSRLPALQTNYTGSQLSVQEFEEYYRIKLESETQITVRFHENPTLSPDAIRLLKQERAITQQAAGKLLRQHFNLSEEQYLPTEAELFEDAKREAKLLKIMQPEPPVGQQDTKAAPDAKPQNKDGAPEPK